MRDVLCPVVSHPSCPVCEDGPTFFFFVVGEVTKTIASYFHRCFDHASSPSLTRWCIARMRFVASVLVAGMSMTEQLLAFEHIPRRSRDHNRGGSVQHLPEASLSEMNSCTQFSSKSLPARVQCLCPSPCLVATSFMSGALGFDRCRRRCRIW